MEAKNKEKHVLSAEFWVTFVILVGVIVGLAVGLSVPPATTNGGTGVGPPPPPQPQPSSQFNFVGNIFSIVSLALLVALLVVYSKIYMSTKAPYVVGLIMFLVALFFEDLVSSPIVLASLKEGFGNLDPYLAIGQVFLCTGLAVFLYLSLE